VRQDEPNPDALRPGLCRADPVRIGFDVEPSFDGSQGGEEKIQNQDRPAERVGDMVVAREEERSEDEDLIARRIKHRADLTRLFPETRQTTIENIEDRGEAQDADRGEPLIFEPDQWEDQKDPRDRKMVGVDPSRDPRQKSFLLFGIGHRFHRPPGGKERADHITSCSFSSIKNAPDASGREHRENGRSAGALKLGAGVGVEPRKVGVGDDVVADLISDGDADDLHVAVACEEPGGVHDLLDSRPERRSGQDLLELIDRDGNPAVRERRDERDDPEDALRVLLSRRVVRDQEIGLLRNLGELGLVECGECFDGFHERFVHGHLQ
jgi:hypothetical protein